MIEFQTWDMRWEATSGHVGTVVSWFPRSSKWSEVFETNSYGLAVPTSGGFARQANGVPQFVDRNVGFFRRPGDEVCVAHVTGVADESTIVHLELDEIDAFDACDWQSGAFVVDPEIDLRHRLLLRDIRRGADRLAIEADLFELVALCLGQGRQLLRSLGRRRWADRSHLVTRVCELLYEDSTASLSLVQLARAVGYSPFHLSRVFHEELGMTLSQYRLRLRVREVVDRLEQGESDLAALAMDTGFADHSHMTRTVVGQLGVAPSILRLMLSDAGAPT